MIIYHAIKSEFVSTVFTRDIESIIRRAFEEKLARKPSQAEERSWKYSLTETARVLNDDSIPASCGIAVEYGIPQSGKRIDVLVSGKNTDGRNNLVVIELKQWDRAALTTMDGIVRARFAQGEANVAHPSYQSWSYAELLRNFNETLHGDDVPIQPCAYLHNCSDGNELLDPFYAYYTTLAPVFLKGDDEREKLRRLIARTMRTGDSGDLILRIENGRIRPSKRLIDALAGMMNGKREFVLIDDQKVTYETAMSRARIAHDGDKQVVIVEGGPGTGKSVVAINLLAALTTDHKFARYVTRNRAPRQVIESTLAGSIRRNDISMLFCGSGAFYDAPKNSVDALIVDEAHRLNAKSGLFSNRGEHQASEIINAARCAIFFIDEDQRVTWKDIGQSGDIEIRARAAGAKVVKLRLASQFRCGGSDGYLAWLDNALGIRETANYELDTSFYDFRVLDSPEELRNLIEASNRVANRARMVAGYCWDWKSKQDRRQMDVVISEHNFAMQWNLASDEGLWITAQNSVQQIGCIHTCQGLEVDYIGVIIGPDLIVRDGIVQTRPEKRSRQDQSLRGYKGALKKDADWARTKADTIIKNTYRTLMTRGMKGCYLYCVDAETAAHFRQRVFCAADLQKAAQTPAYYGASQA